MMMIEMVHMRKAQAGYPSSLKIAGRQGEERYSDAGSSRWTKAVETMMPVPR
jgi:hypothetical protein